MKIQINFPQNLFSDIRIEEISEIWYKVENNDVQKDSDVNEIGAMIRVFDGNLWYTATTNDLSQLQKELDSLAELATPNEKIMEHPYIKNLEVNQDSKFIFTGEKDDRNITRQDLITLCDDYISHCTTDAIEEINLWGCMIDVTHKITSYFSSIGTALEHDFQEDSFSFYYGITVNGNTTYAFKSYQENEFYKVKGHFEEVLKERDKVLDYARNAVDGEPGDYECVLAPVVTAMFTHESFGHKSESDFMLNDETLQKEWVMGKKVGSELVSICDDGNLVNHGYTPYDAEGNKAKETWLIKEGVLTGRLHDAKSAATLKEAITGNSRAQNYTCSPVVRMTNTFMEAGNDDPKEMIKGIKNGIYVSEVSSGTGQGTFTMRPTICYKIKDGKICEPVRYNVINGSVFKTLFDIDAVGNDFQLFDTYYCGKSGQMVTVSSGGPTIRVKSLNFN